MTDIETEGDKHSGTRINDTPFPCSGREAIEVHVDARNRRGLFTCRLCAHYRRTYRGALHSCSDKGAMEVIL